MQQVSTNVRAIVSVAAAVWPLVVIGCQPSGSEARKPPDLTRAVALREALIGGTSAGTSGGDQAAAASKAEPEGWATLSGVFRLDGTPPSPPALNITKDVGVCAPGGKTVYSEALKVASDGSLKDVLVFLTSKIPDEEPWTHPSAAPGQGGEVEFDQKECIFLSHVLGIQTSQKLKILNSDPVGHNTALKPKASAEFNQIIPSNGFSFYQPTDQENAPYPVSCSIHPWMNAWIMVRDDSYLAISKEDGTFQIPNLPAGVELEFRVWQETFKYVQDVMVNGESQKWSKGRFRITLDPSDATKNQLEVVLKLP